jgi:hypothetical protein
MVEQPESIKQMKEKLEGFDWRSMTPEDSPKTPADLFDDEVVRDLSTAKIAVGDDAYDFELPVNDFSDGIERVTDQTMRLSAVARERPVALIFGSYT